MLLFCFPDLPFIFSAVPVGVSLSSGLFYFLEKTFKKMPILETHRFHKHCSEKHISLIVCPDVPNVILCDQYNYMLIIVHELYCICAKMIHSLAVKLECDFGYEIIILFKFVCQFTLTHFKLLILHGLFPPSAFKPLVILTSSYHLT